MYGTNITGLILAGGAGTRLRPFSYVRPKPMMPVINKPLLQYQIELLRGYGISEIVLCLGREHTEVVRFFGDGHELGVNISYSIEETPLGTAGAIRNAEQYIRNDTVLAMNGDGILDFDLSELADFHSAKHAEATIGLVHVPKPTPCGVVVRDDDSRIRAFQEPDRDLKRSLGSQAVTSTETATVNAGIYVISRAAILSMDPGVEISIEKQFFPALISDGVAVFGHVLDGYWIDIGSPQTYLQANMDLLSGKTLACLPGETVASGYRVQGTVCVDATAQVASTVVLGDAVKIGARVRIGELTSIGSGCIISDGADVEGSVLLENVKIGSGSHIRGCVIDRDSEVGEGVSLGSRSIIGAGSRII
jgi:mannose-1-phosphate guanylyltransferase/phosphomannomutase